MIYTPIHNSVRLEKEVNKIFWQAVAAHSAQIELQFAILTDDPKRASARGPLLMQGLLDCFGIPQTMFHFVATRRINHSHNS